MILGVFIITVGAITLKEYNSENLKKKNNEAQKTKILSRR